MHPNSNIGSGIRFQADFYDNCEEYLNKNRIYKRFDYKTRKQILKKFISLCKQYEQQIFVGNIESYSKQELIEEVLSEYCDLAEEYEYEDEDEDEEYEEGDGEE
jgi:hypothetical protein